jgi:DNA-directed RNA polymerase specialized sigma24 family protein
MAPTFIAWRSRPLRRPPIVHPETENTSPTYWCEVLKTHGLQMWRGKYARDGGKGHGVKILLARDAFPLPDGDVEEQTDAEILDSMILGKHLEHYLAKAKADERLCALVQRFMSLTAREAAAHFGLNPGTVYRLQREFFEERPERPEVAAARKALNCADEHEDDSNVLELPVMRAVLYLALGEAA